jgi:hypothetical protein
MFYQLCMFVCYHFVLSVVPSLSAEFSYYYWPGFFELAQNGLQSLYYRYLTVDEPLLFYC